ncbi:hypothetical protein BU15DRAFT_73700 [Melanogaster broomeanus]|nr:hypothetical protein BU15DRAFT_73700 [Melanogaster broomeanus]
MERPRTPPPRLNTVSVTPDTVPRPRHTSAQRYRTGDLTYGREVVLRDLQHIGRVPFSYLKEALLPPLPPGVEIKHIKSSLAKSKKLTRSGRWAAFSVDPSVATEKEEYVFEGLRDVFNDVVYVAKASTDRLTSLELVNNPSVALQSARPSSSRPDAYLLLVEKKTVSFEFKKGAGESGQKDDDVKIEEVEDDTRQLLRGKDLPDPMSWYNVSPDKEPSPRPHTFSVENVPLFPVRTAIRGLVSQKIQHKQHFRLVFEEIGQPIFALKSLHDVSGTLGYAVNGFVFLYPCLRYMHMAGWVHRDLSSANVLRYEDRGLLVDLEYAKRMNSSESHEVRTGTTNFMACEVEAQAYRFLSSSTVTEDDIFKLVAPPIAQPPFRANPLHDLESSWWILMWVLYYHVDSKTRTPGQGQEFVYRQYFPGLALPEGQDRTGYVFNPLNFQGLPRPFLQAAGRG